MPVQPTSASTDDLRIWLLGGLRVSVGGRDLIELRWAKRLAALLKLLALAPGHVLHREVVQDALWPELVAPAAANNLHGTLHVVRRLFEPELRPGRQSRFVVLQGSVVRLSSPSVLWIDVEAFELAASGALRSCDPAAYEAACALYQGDLLPEDVYADWAGAQRDALRQRYVELLAGLAALYEQAGDLSSAVATLHRLVALEPADEDAVAHLMRLYTLQGRRHLALRQYQQLQRALQRDLDCQPEGRVVQLRNQIVRSANNLHIRAQLTEREEQIGQLIARGLTNRHIAMTLNMSIRTAETHVSRILHKLELCSREQVALAFSSLRNAGV